MKDSFKKTFGVILATIATLAFLFIIAFVHDEVIVDNYTKTGSLNSQNKWGDLIVDVDVTKQDITKERSYTSSYEENPFICAKKAREENRNESDCLSEDKVSKTFTDDGEYTISGNIYIKNRKWVQSTEIPEQLIKWRYTPKEYDDNRNLKQSQAITTGNVEIDGFNLGGFLGARRGASAKFTIKVPISAQDGHIVLVNDDNVIEVK